MRLEDFFEYVRGVRDLSSEMFIPSITEDEGFILYSIVYTYSVLRNERLLAIDAGAGIGYSTIWISKALIDSGCSGCRVIAIEREEEYFRYLRSNLEKPLFKDLEFVFYNGDAVEYIKRLNNGPDIVFIDIDKHQYPVILEILLEKIREGIIIFHNAIYPPPPRKIFKILDKNMIKYTIIPTVNGLLIAYTGKKTR
ncbi:MAG: hypothetical protein B6U89_01575 [Desulfurococcales archaeon ex4484_58]|nr:MAG: hypothetical protein B6U89_01575 [Desulfurococcales archaeon ex4484_58]